MRPDVRAALPLLAWLALAGCDGTGPSPSTPLELVSVAPAAGSSGADVLTHVTLTFNRPIRVESVPGTITFSAGGHEARKSIWLQDDRTLVIIPHSPLDFGTQYDVGVAATLTDANGNRLSSDFFSTFTTLGAAPPDPDETRIRQIVSVLAADSLLGRGSGTPDEERAAAYLAQLFTDYGLEPPGPGYLQPFTGEAWSGGAVESQNVLASVPGAGALADEWVVVGGHYDHVGLRPAGDGFPEVHNGADDNASGTAVVLELARLYSRYVEEGGTGEQPRRSVMFAAWGAEEKGLLGSCAFVDSEALSLDRITATINFDMVGRMTAGRVEVNGQGSSAPLHDFVVDANEPGLHVLQDPSGGCRNCSDHSCFRAAGIPYIWFFTGLHPDYHTPADDYEWLRFDGTTAIADLAFRILTRLAVTTAPLPFDPSF